MKCEKCGYTDEIQSWKLIREKDIIICPQCKHKESLEMK